jgi:hypothetical protein
VTHTIPISNKQSTGYSVIQIVQQQLPAQRLQLADPIKKLFDQNALTRKVLRFGRRVHRLLPRGPPLQHPMESIGVRFIFGTHTRIRLSMVFDQVFVRSTPVCTMGCSLSDCSGGMCSIGKGTELGHC